LWIPFTFQPASEAPQTFTLITPASYSKSKRIS